MDEGQERALKEQAAVEQYTDWIRSMPFTGWLAIVFYVAAVFYFINWLDSSYDGLLNAAISVSCLVTGAMLGAVSRIIRILRSIRDSLDAD